LKFLDEAKDLNIAIEKNEKMINILDKENIELEKNYHSKTTRRNELQLTLHQNTLQLTNNRIDVPVDDEQSKRIEFILAETNRYFLSWLIFINL
jgi:tRNA splicing endonuclease